MFLVLLKPPDDSIYCFAEEAKEESGVSSRNVLSQSLIPERFKKGKKMVLHGGCELLDRKYLSNLLL